MNLIILGIFAQIVFFVSVAAITTSILRLNSKRRKNNFWVTMGSSSMGVFVGTVVYRLSIHKALLRPDDSTPAGIGFALVLSLIFFSLAFFIGRNNEA
jgi:hypothetical protein